MLDEEQDACLCPPGRSHGPNTKRVNGLWSRDRPRRAVWGPDKSVGQAGEGLHERRNGEPPFPGALREAEGTAQMDDPRYARVVQHPRVKSGKSTGALPAATDCSLRAAGALHAAAS